MHFWCIINYVLTAFFVFGDSRHLIEFLQSEKNVQRDENYYEKVFDKSQNSNRKPKKNFNFRG